MVRIDIVNGRVTAQELFVLQSFEASLTEFIRQQVNTDEYRHLKVGLDLRVVEKGQEPLMVTHDASFSLRGSFSFHSLVDKFIRTQQSVCVCLREYSLLVKLTYREQPVAEKKEKEKDRKTSDETPDFYPVAPRYTFSQIILPEETSKEIFDALKVIECKELVYQQWGFSEVDAIPRSVLNFYGEPGTGKTMCAHAIAHYLGKKFLALNYSEIESKYVGEAPKNLAKAFETAKSLDAVLFFDEADSFLGKRVQNVSQGSDQALNSLRSQMLILLEEFPGVVLFATNLVSNFDKAFESRILKHIKFELPNKEARVAILRKMLPSKLPVVAPFSQEQLEQVSEEIEGLSGREIKTAVLSMLLAKADVKNPDVRFAFDDLRTSLLKKMDEKRRLKEEEEKRLKEKISKKLEEKAAEVKEEKELKEHSLDEQT